MSLAPRDLVDRDLIQIAEPVLVDQLGADTLDDPADRLPVDPREPAGRCLVGLRHQPRDEVLEIAGEAGAVAGERDALHQRAVLGAAQPPQPGVNLQAPTAEIQVPPDRVVTLLVLPMARGVRALRATKATTAQRDRDNDSVTLELDRADPHTGQVKQTRECGRDAHGPNLQLGDLEHPRAYGPTRARLPSPQSNPATSKESLLRPRNPGRSPRPRHQRSPPEPLISAPRR